MSPAGLKIPISQISLRFFYENGIPVPRIIRHDAAAGLILLEDLGDTDLWLLRNAPWEQRQSLYQKTLVAAHRLHSIPESQFPSDRIRLMEPFGPELYRWERNYFMDNFVAALCGIKLEADRAKRAGDGALRSRGKARVRQRAVSCTATCNRRT